MQYRFREWVDRIDADNLCFYRTHGIDLLADRIEKVYTKALSL
jgi:hypothetical protein